MVVTRLPNNDSRCSLRLPPSLLKALRVVSTRGLVRNREKLPVAHLSETANSDKVRIDRNEREGLVSPRFMRQDRCRQDSRGA